MGDNNRIIIVEHIQHIYEEGELTCEFTDNLVL